MKKSIIYLGIALVTFSNVITALAQQSFIKGDCLTQTASSDPIVNKHTLDNHSIEARITSEDEDQANSSLELISITTHQKTVEEIIAENNLIIDSPIVTDQYDLGNQIDISIEDSPVTNDKTIEERILQDSQIIDSQILEVIQPTVLTKPKK